MTECFDNAIKTAIINILIIFKKGELNMNMMKIETEYIKKDQNQTSSNETYMDRISSTIDTTEEKGRKRRKSEQRNRWDR